MQRIAFVVALLVTSSALAESVPEGPHLQRQIQADVGLTVINLGYEEPIAKHWAFQVEGGIFGTYFLPWFDLGDEVRGWGGGTRLTWFARECGRGPYIAPYLRVNRISGDDEAGVAHTGFGIAAGVFAGWAFRLHERLDLRVGIGAQYIYLDAPPLGASTPFVALDAVIGYRL